MKLMKTGLLLVASTVGLVACWKPTAPADPACSAPSSNPARLLSPHHLSAGID